MRLSSALFNCMLTTSSSGYSTMSLGANVPANDCSYCEKFLSYIEMKPLSV